jgi:uncharacterized protein
MTTQSLMFHISASQKEKAAIDVASSCRTCGACCSFSRDWPRFTTDSDTDLDRIPREFVSERVDGMRCCGERCSALLGEVGILTTCAIYEVRPDVCRACGPGDEACLLARHAFGL